MKIEFIRTEAELLAAYEALQNESRISFDLETTGLDPYTNKILLAQFYAPGLPCYVVQPNALDIRLLLSILTWPGKITLAHNASFEYRWIYRHYGLKLNAVYCSMIAEQVLTAGLDYDHSLGATIKRHLDIDLDKSLQKSFIGLDPETWIPTKEQLEYAAKDVMLLHRLRQSQVEQLITLDLVNTAMLEFDVLPVIAEMELAGLLLDKEKHAKIIQEYQSNADYYGNMAAEMLDPFYQDLAKQQYDLDMAQYLKLQAELDALKPILKRPKKQASYLDNYTELDVFQAKMQAEDLKKERDKIKPKPITSINLNSLQQVQLALAGAGIALPDLKADTIQANADRHEILSIYAKYKQAETQVTKFGAGLLEKINPVTNRLHSDFNQAKTASGRMSSSRPNLQNMPPEIRHCIVPAAGHKLIVLDYAQMEIRIVADLAGDKVLLDMIRSGVDMHSYTASNTWPDLYPSWKDVPKKSDHRTWSKVANFAIIYGAGVNALVMQGVPDKDTAKKLIEGFQTTCPVLWSYLQECGEMAINPGYIATANGRKRFFPQLPEKPKGYQAGRDWEVLAGGYKRAAKNHPVQGTGADITKLAMVLINNRLQGRGTIINAVHDELVIECKEEFAETVKSIAETGMLESAAKFIKSIDIPADGIITEIWDK